MPEEPEQVLPEQRIPAPRGVEEGQIEGTLNFEQDRAEDQRRKADQHHGRHDQHVPGKDRHAGERLPGALSLRMVTMSSIAADKAEISTKVIPSSQTSALMPGEYGFEASGVYMNQATVRRDAEDQGGDQKRTSEQITPVSVGRHARKGEIACGRASWEADRSPVPRRREWRRGTS